MTPLQHRPHEVQSSDEADKGAGRGSILVGCITRSHSTHRVTTGQNRTLPGCPLKLVSPAGFEPATY